jgi:hypothetical protein
VLSQRTPIEAPSPPASYNPKDHPYLATTLGFLALTAISATWATGLTLCEVKDDTEAQLKVAKKRITELEESLRSYRFLSGEFEGAEPPSAVKRN